MTIQLDDANVGDIHIAGAVNGDRTVDADVIVGYRDGVVVLTLVGEHDLSTANRLVALITDHASRGRSVVVVLSQVEFIDSAIVTALFNGERQMLAYGRRLVLELSIDSPISRLLEMSGLRTRLICTNTLGHAVRLAAERTAVLTTD